MTSWTQYSQSKTIPPDRLAEKAAQIRIEGKSIATLNGSFDLLHAGHMYMIYEASKRADVLILAVNSDESVCAYKGPERPIVPLPYRMEILTALAFVDFVTWFDETDPRSILEVIRPDVHVNGEEYGEDCIEAEVVKKNGGKLHLVDRIPGLATSEIIKRIEGLQKSTCV
ncbi:MAG: adenylyltransferase/cytidyltransferase family protein [Chlamydiales bacterium]|nr:adenylyltransferase/cytidyltransferase family protein [Chlamydiales bacterium]